MLASFSLAFWSMARYPFLGAAFEAGAGPVAAGAGLEAGAGALVVAAGVFDDWRGFRTGGFVVFEDEGAAVPR